MKDILENGRLSWRLINDPRVPSWVKVAIPLAVALYFFSPIDFIPDFIFGFGQLDDLGVILLGMSLIVRFSPQHVVEEHRQALHGGAFPGGTSNDPPTNRGGYWNSPPTKDQGEPTRSIDGEYRVVPPKDRSRS